MTETKQLIGSLSNDLLRVAVLTQRGSLKGAHTFFNEAQARVQELAHHKVEYYISNIINDLHSYNENPFSLLSAEKFLMYSVLLQNYSLHHD
jgi:hypothetical protein